MLGINLKKGKNLYSKSEKRSYIRFLIIYTLSTFLLIVAGLTIFYRYNSHKIIEQQYQALKLKTLLIYPKLKELHKSTNYPLLYPKIEGIKSALYDIEHNYLIGEFKPKFVAWDKEFSRVKDNLYYIYKMEPYFLGTAFVVSTTKLDKTPLEALRLKIALATLFAVIFIAIIAMWLGRLFLAPIKETIELLERFIQDTTHELNTPISTILTNIELIKSMYKELENSKELNRIEVASKRLSRLYDDLVYLQLRHQKRREIEKIELDRLLRERLAYFEPLVKRKAIVLNLNISSSVILEIDKEDAMRIIDNIISNAIKYTNYQGSIYIELNKEAFIVKDSGIGMDKEEIKRATKRFFRADRGVGGFGLGLSIVSELIDYYGMRLIINSKKGVGTEVKILWQR